jgi:hypothetical protein
MVLIIFVRWIFICCNRRFFLLLVFPFFSFSSSGNFQPPFERSILYNVFESPYSRTRDLLVAAVRHVLSRASADTAPDPPPALAEFLTTVLKDKDLQRFMIDIGTSDWNRVVIYFHFFVIWILVCCPLHF